MLDVGESTIKRWKEDPQFLDVLKKGKMDAVLNVFKSLYKKTQGFEYQEVTQEGKPGADGEIKVTSIKRVKKYYPPDTASIAIWGRNRMGWIDRNVPEYNSGLQSEELEKLRKLASKEYEESI